MSRSRGIVRSVRIAGLLSEDSMDALGLANVFQEDPLKAMSKYWRKTVTGDYSAMWKKWRTDIANAPKDGTWFMGRITGTNRAMAVIYEGETDRWMTKDEGAVDICQWLSFTDWADIRSCAWRQI